MLNTDGTDYGTFSDSFDMGAFNIDVGFLRGKGINPTGANLAFMVLSEEPTGGVWGRRIAQTQNGNLTGSFSSDGNSYIGILNGRNNVDYAGAFATPVTWGNGFGKTIIGQNVTVRMAMPGERLSANYTTVDGPEEPFLEAVAWSGDIMRIGDIPLAKFQYLGKTATPATMRCGYVPLSEYPDNEGALGLHGPDAFVVIDWLRGDFLTSRNIAFVEMFESFCSFNDLYGQASRSSVMNNQTPSAAGRDLIRAGVLYGIR